MEKVELQPPLLGAQAFFQTFEVQAQVEACVLQRRFGIRKVEGGPIHTSFFIFHFFPNSQTSSIGLALI